MASDQNMDAPRKSAYIVNRAALDNQYPTQKLSPEFWESLGRTIATFSFLENVLSKAIFAFTATKPYPAEEIEVAFQNWLPQLERSLSDPLGGLIDAYGKAVRLHPHASIENFEKLVEDLRSASALRNAFCHGSWGAPNSTGASVPFFLNRQKQRFGTPVDRNYLEQVRLNCVDLICSVIDTVTYMGWQFPGSSGPGEVVWSTSQ